MIDVIIQARMGSERLYGKILKNLYDKSVLSHVIERVKQCKEVDRIIIATTIHERDKLLIEEAKKNNVLYYAGSEDDVLERYYGAATKYESETVVRITSDCPLIDPIIIDSMLKKYLEGTYELVSNVSTDIKLRTFPRGLDVEIFSYKQLKEAYEKADKKYHREHVTPYIYENCQSFYCYKNNVDLSEYRWTLDTPEDLELILNVYEELYKGEHNFFLKEITNLFERHPELQNINRHIEQKKLGDD